jgi:hypothetical protein
MTGPRAEIHDGGPAFPTERFTSYGNGAGATTREGGMTLRDWFATHASEDDIAEHRWQGILADGSYGYNLTREEARYRHADAMLAARGVKP